MSEHYKMEFPACDLCGHPGPHKILERNIKESEHDFVECACGLRFYSPRRAFQSLLDFGFGTNGAAKKEAEFFFQNLAFRSVRDRGHQEQVLRSYYGRMLDDVCRYKTIKSLFEVGCSIGFFLNLAKERGIAVKGCDLNYYAARIAYREYQIDVMGGPFGFYCPNEEFDCVVALDYIEHSYIPYRDLCRLSMMLPSGGLLLLKTFLDELDLDRDMVCPPFHAHHFTEPVLRKTLAKAGFNILNWRIDYKEQAVVIAEKL